MVQGDTADWGRQQRRATICDGGAMVLVGWGSYMPNWLAREHQEATLVQVEVMVGAEDGTVASAMKGRR